MSYKQIHETFWTDPEIKHYKPTFRYLYSYFITGPHAHYSGLYYLPIIYIQNETGLTVKDIKEGITFLSGQGHISYDEKREVIFIKSEMMYQWDCKDRTGQIKMNEKQITGLLKHFDTLHKSPLIAKFLETYAYLNLEYTVIDRGIDTRINTGIDRVSVPVPVPVIVPDAVEEGGAGGNTTSRFDDFWSAYPKKKAKGDAEKAWAKLNPSESLAEKILSAVQRAMTSEDWLKDNGQFIPYPATWLNRKGWEDEFTPTLQNPLLSKSSEGIMGWAARERARMAQKAQEAGNDNR